MHVDAFAVEADVRDAEAVKRMIDDVVTSGSGWTSSSTTPV